MAMPRSMSVIIPVFNEAEEIVTIVRAVRHVLEARDAGWEIVVVDNASTDDTVDRLRPLLVDGQIRLLRNEQNRGKGYSVRRGMLEAVGELRLMCDADCAPSLASLPAMEAMLDSCEIVTGARNAPDSQVARHQPVSRRAASLGFIFLCRRVMGEPLRDVFCGFKLFTADAANDVFSRSRIDGWAFDAEALAVARRLGYRIRPCGIAWVNRPGSRLSIPHVVVPVLRELVATRVHLRGQDWRARPVHDALQPVGGASPVAAPAAAGAAESVAAVPQSRGS
jgi:dolichyl-phosphate beta-glucosyltransferase